MRGIGKTPGKLAQEIIETELERYADSDTVKKALVARREQAAREEGTLTDMSSRARGRGAREGTP